MKTEIKEPIISIDRASKSWACFDGFELLHGFNNYSREAEAVELARAWFQTQTKLTPLVVFPRIKSMRIS